MNPRDIVWCEQDGRLVPGVVRELRGRTVVVCAADASEQVLAERRIVHTSDTRASVPATDATGCAAALGRHLAAVEAAAANVALDTLWDLFVDGGGTVTLEELAELALGERQGAARDALALALFRDTLYFKVRKEGWAPNPRRTVDELRRQREREAEEEAAILRLARALTDVGSDPADREEAFRLVEEVALLADGAPHFARALKVMDALAPTPADEPAFRALRMLVRLGRYGEDEDLNLRRHRIRRDYPADVTAEAERIAAAGIAPFRAGRRDLTGLFVVTIDDETTTEVDDGLAIEVRGELTTVHILIADPATFVQPGSALDDEARRRGATLYHPVERFPMIPALISEGVASLTLGEERLALDFAVTLDPAGAPVALTLAEAVIRVGRRMSYDEVDALLAATDVTETDQPARTLVESLQRLAIARRARRVEAGAIALDRTEIMVRVTPEGDVVLRKHETGTPSHRIVSEMMILACAQAAIHCRDERIPAVFRRQAPPEDGVRFDPAKGGDPVAVQEALRQMKKAELTLRPDRHYSLGVEAYTQVTSPLRRYQDLVVHRQLKASLRGAAAPYPEAELLALFAEVEEAASSYQLIDREARRYWTMKLLGRRAGEELDAIVLREAGKRVIVELSDYGLQIPFGPRGPVTPGQRLKLVVSDVAPRRDRLSLREAAR